MMAGGVDPSGEAWPSRVIASKYRTRMEGTRVLRARSGSFGCVGLKRIHAARPGLILEFRNHHTSKTATRSVNFGENWPAWL
jgi:hypothetical protein